MPPKQGGAPFRVSPTLGAWALGGSGAPAHFGLDPFPLQPMGPSGIGGPIRWIPGTLPVVPIQYR